LNPSVHAELCATARRITEHAVPARHKDVFLAALGLAEAIAHGTCSQHIPEAVSGALDDIGAAVTVLLREDGEESTVRVVPAVDHIRLALETSEATYLEKP